MTLREQICFSIAAMEPAIQGAAYQQGFFDAKAEALRRAEVVTPEPPVCACSITVVNGGHPWTDASECPVHKQQAESANARY